MDIGNVSNLIIRRLFVTDKNGKEHQIRTREDLEKIILEMTSKEYEQYKNNYRFSPVQNLTGIKDYTGTVRDLL